MPTNSPVDNYANGYSVLNDFSSEIYRETMRLFRPITSGENVIRHTRAGIAKRSIDQMMNLSYQQQDAFLDFLTELVIEKKRDEEWEKFMKSLIDKIYTKSQFKIQFEALENQFMKLTENQQKQILILSINKMNASIDGIRREINTRLWIEKAKTLELLAIDQVLYFFQNLINSIPLTKKLSDQQWNKINRRIGFGVYLVLRLEAFRRKKINLDDLNEDLSLSRMFEPTETIIKPSEYELALEVFGG